MGPGLKPPARLIAILALCACATSCGTQPARGGADEEAGRAAIARAAAQIATRVAVSKVGAQVCKQFKTGISEIELLRGTVSALDSDRILVRVDVPGRFPSTLNGILVARGAQIWDLALDWIPCS